jgi:hypothetical protein
MFKDPNTNASSLDSLSPLSIAVYDKTSKKLVVLLRFLLLTHAMSNGRFRASQISLQPIPTTTLFWKSSIAVVLFEIGGPGKLQSHFSAVAKRLKNCTHMRLLSQTSGDDLSGIRMTPIFASPNSFASKWASVAPTMVRRICFLPLTSASCFRSIKVAIISAL